MHTCNSGTEREGEGRKGKVTRTGVRKDKNREKGRMDENGING